MDFINGLIEDELYETSNQSSQNQSLSKEAIKEIIETEFLVKDGEYYDFIDFGE